MLFANCKDDCDNNAITENKMEKKSNLKKGN